MHFKINIISKEFILVIKVIRVFFVLFRFLCLLHRMECLLNYVFFYPRLFKKKLSKRSYYLNFTYSSWIFVLTLCNHSHKKWKDSLETRLALLMFSLELEISGVTVQSLHKNNEKWRLL